MGEDKAFLEIEGAPIIKRIHDLFEKIFNEIIIVTNQKEPFSGFAAKIYSDLFPNRGALGGLYTGLFFSSYPYAFCVACDMPFLNRSLIEYLLMNIEGYDVIVPRTSDGFQPLHAVYSKNCLEPMKDLIDADGFKIFDFYPRVRLKTVGHEEVTRFDPDLESFINVNTREDLISARRRAR
jgi:molybdenum cofactor guanylyltransferase